VTTKPKVRPKAAVDRTYPDGWFSEPAVRWFGKDWVPRLTNPKDPLYISRHLSKSTGASNRDEGLLSGANWAKGYMGRFSQKESSIDIFRARPVERFVPKRRK
jgi:hypothetical protein